MNNMTSLTIVIFGPYKSGTTGVFYKIRNSLPWTPKPLFEAKSYEYQPGDSKCGVLAKIILGVSGESDGIRYETFMGFQKKIYLVRDPRDLIISGILFMIQQEPSIYSESTKLERILEMLRQKEENPQRFSVCELFRTVVRESDHHDWNGVIDWLTRQYKWLPYFESGLTNYYRLRYEDFVDGKLGGLESYLGLRLDGVAQVDRTHGHVPRTLGYDNWKNWFVPEDIDFFRPLLEDYIKCYGYDNQWQLNVKQAISPEHSSKYVMRTVDMRRNR